MRALVACALLLVACGGHDKAPAAPTPTSEATAPADEVKAPTEIERRRDAACDALGPRLTECAIADAKKTMTPAQLAELDLEKTAPVHTRKFVEDCKGQQLSSRQVRVYEVCLREAPGCDELLTCLDAAKPAPATP